jgi:hypothetical protein
MDVRVQIEYYLFFTLSRFTFGAKKTKGALIFVR